MKRIDEIRMEAKIIRDDKLLMSGKEVEVNFQKAEKESNRHCQKTVKGTKRTQRKISFVKKKEKAEEKNAYDARMAKNALHNVISERRKENVKTSGQKQSKRNYGKRKGANK